jgi:hypothetical protein
VDSVLQPEYEKYILDSPIKVISFGVVTDSVNLANFAAVEAAVGMNQFLEQHFPSILTP